MHDSDVETETGASSSQVATQAQGSTNGGGNGVGVLDRLKRLSLAPVEIKRVLFPEPYQDIEWWIRKGKTKERERWENENTVKGKNGRPDSMAKENVRANLIIKASVFPDRRQMFEPGKESQNLINDLPADLVEYVFDGVIEYWGIKRKDADEIQGGNS